MLSKDTAATQPRERGKFVKAEKISFDDAVKLAEYIIQGREDYVYDEQVNGKCSNWNITLDRPSCLVGWILFEWGVPKEELIAANHGSAYDFSRYFNNDKVSNFLGELQAKQDRKIPWGGALQEAKRVIKQAYRDA